MDVINQSAENLPERLCGNIPNYSAYAERTDRNIEIYRLSPREQAQLTSTRVGNGETS